MTLFFRSLRRLDSSVLLWMFGVKISRWWFQIFFFYFHPYLGKISTYFSDGLIPPTSLRVSGPLGCFGEAGCIRWCTAFWCTKTWTPTLRPVPRPAIGTLRVLRNDMLAEDFLGENLRKVGGRFHVEIEFAEDSSNVGNFHANFSSNCTFWLYFFWSSSYFPMMYDEKTKSRTTKSHQTSLLAGGFK